jgi:hypothetical protein
MVVLICVIHQTSKQSKPVVMVTKNMGGGGVFEISGTFGTHVENYKFRTNFFVEKPEGDRPLALSRR